MNTPTRKQHAFYQVVTHVKSCLNSSSLHKANKKKKLRALALFKELILYYKFLNRLKFTMLKQQFRAVSFSDTFCPKLESSKIFCTWQITWSGTTALDVWRCASVRRSTRTLIPLTSIISLTFLCDTEKSKQNVWLVRIVWSSGWG